MKILFLRSVKWYLVHETLQINGLLLTINYSRINLGCIFVLILAQRYGQRMAAGKVMLNYSNGWQS